MNGRPSTNEAIFAATLRLIGEHGLHGATTRAIADEAGVNEVTLFRKFGSKAGLVRAAIEARFSSFEATSLTYTGDVEADLVRLVTGYRDFLEELGPVARSLLTELPFVEEVAAATTTLRGVIADVTALIGRYQDEGILQPEPTATLIPALFGPIVLPVITRDFAIIDQGDPSNFDPARHVARFLHGRAEPTR